VIPPNARAKGGRKIDFCVTQKLREMHKGLGSDQTGEAEKERERKRKREKRQTQNLRGVLEHFEHEFFSKLLLHGHHELAFMVWLSKGRLRRKTTFVRDPREAG
jgi:DNA repair protein RadC